MDIDYDEIKRDALDVLDKYDITEPVVNVMEISKGVGVEIKEMKMSQEYKDVAGFYDAGSEIIYINSSDKPTRKLFTIAHELGHIFLEHKNYSVLFRVPKKDTSYTKAEKEANCFAANLLMPDFMLKTYMTKYNLTINDSSKMAEIFGVPLVSMIKKLEYLK